MPETVTELQGLLEAKRAADQVAAAASDELRAALYRARVDEGASVRQIALALGVSPSSVQKWIREGEQLAQTD